MKSCCRKNFCKCTLFSYLKLNVSIENPLGIGCPASAVFCFAVNAFRRFFLFAVKSFRRFFVLPFRRLDLFLLSQPMISPMHRK